MLAEVLAVSSPDHVEVHVELGRDVRVNQLADLVHRLLLDVFRQVAEHVEVEVAHRDAHLHARVACGDVHGAVTHVPGNNVRMSQGRGGGGVDFGSTMRRRRVKQLQA
eukprot:6201402-Pleurochrysis_carterae.AAC.5